jgi:hypothetical protein
VLWKGGHIPKSKSKQANGGTTETETEDEDDPDAIIQQLDIPLASSVISIAVPPPPQDQSVFSSDFYPQILSSRIVLAASCSDSHVRIVSLPLAPPTDEFKEQAEKRKSSDGLGKFGEQILILSQTQQVSNLLALSFTSETPDQEPGVIDIAPTPARPTRGGNDSKHWQLIVAAHTNDVNGVLQLASVPVVSKKSGNKVDYRFSADSLSIYHSEYLFSPARSLEFSPIFSNLQLLLSDTSGIVNLFDAKACQFLASFKTSHLPHNNSRKTILDAKWAHSGDAIVVLLSDSQWGIWNLTDPVTGGGTTKFTLSGWLGKASTQSSRSSKELSPKFVPMTPGTRRAHEQDLFVGSQRKSSNPTGSISVSKLSSLSSSLRRDDQIVFNLDGILYLIPSLVAYEARATQGRSTSSSVPANTYGAPILNLSILPRQGDGILSGSELILFAHKRLVVIKDLPKPVASQVIKPISLGETLDVTAIDRLLGDMESRDEARSRTTKRKVGFLSP